MKTSLCQAVAGSIGTGRVARARPDGYTIDLASNSTHVLFPFPTMC
jgi:tripartite-type tricarboxylate transporter receptor subunit TctC